MPSQNTKIETNKKPYNPYIDGLRAISVLSVLEDRNDIYIDVQDSVMKNSMMKVRLGFQKKPLIITSITVIDIAQDSDISIHLSDIKINQQVIDSVFEFKDPNFFKKIGWSNLYI